MRFSIEKIKNALLLGALLLSGCTINFVKHPAEPQVLHEQIEYFKWLYEKGFYRSEPELMKRAAMRVFDERPPGDDRGVSARLEQLLLRLEQDIEQAAKHGREPAAPGTAPSEPRRR